MSVIVLPGSAGGGGGSSGEGPPIPDTHLFIDQANGDDSNDGSEENPIASWGKALALVGTGPAYGDVWFTFVGEYNGNIVIDRRPITGSTFSEGIWDIEGTGSSETTINGQIVAHGITGGYNALYLSGFTCYGVKLYGCHDVAIIDVHAPLGEVYLRSTTARAEVSEALNWYVTGPGSRLNWSNSVGESVFLQGGNLEVVDPLGTFPTGIFTDGPVRIAGGDVQHITAGTGPVILSPNGTKHRIRVANDGSLSTEPA